MRYDFTRNFSSFPSVQKDSLDPSICAHVDLALKRLKLVTRRLSTTLTALEDESRLLDRLFYKGKNQHRTSLFWRHVQEMRRLCSRFNGLDLSKSVTQIRHSFYNSTDYQK
ncbi:hypothetical protein P691DRAFT_724893 [Macrolepiota fuliginosa MF-IS2]|uniref:Nucleolus and neural progenitor protein-like N-terminal domain-containing protein n=1 Tax=Macrolepiota fuliginosa MF-IS2 TaxID=1400762 RepID=A0A9P6C3U1_9AGAR|nr:hypothetical protein P691DRAFT_724893 [Macrolepiota fuliginosa MF-IS2]